MAEKNVPVSGLSDGQSSSNITLKIADPTAPKAANPTKPSAAQTPNVQPTMKGIKKVTATAGPGGDAPLIPMDDPSATDVPGQYNGIGAFIDGYIRMNRRRYTAKPLDIATGKL
jgi:hypothetical protein